MFKEMIDQMRWKKKFKEIISNPPEIESLSVLAWKKGDAQTYFLVINGSDYFGEYETLRKTAGAIAFVLDNAEIGELVMDTCDGLSETRIVQDRHDQGFKEDILSVSERQELYTDIGEITKEQYRRKANLIAWDNGKEKEYCCIISVGEMDLFYRKGDCGNPEALSVLERLFYQSKPWKDPEDLSSPLKEFDIRPWNIASDPSIFEKDHPELKYILCAKKVDGYVPQALSPQELQKAGVKRG